MTDFITDLTNDLFEIDDIQGIINLETEQLQQAVLVSEQINNQYRQWQVYFQCLTLFAFEEWLCQREPSLTLHKEESSTLKHQYANVIDAVCNLEIGDFKVCLIPSMLLMNGEVAIPRAVIDLPEYAAHFYIVIGVDEESEIAAVKGFLRYEQLVNIKTELQPETDWNYYIPLAQFNQKVDELLLFLQCLAPTAIPLPEIPSSRENILRRVQLGLLNLLPQLNNRPLWEVLTWEQGTAILTTPLLLNWVYQSINQNAVTLTNHLSDLLQILTQQTVNVGVWLADRVDDAVQTLSWQLIPAASELRSTLPSNSIEELEIILRDIQVQEEQLDIPTTAIRAYQDIQLDKLLRLYAIIWSLPEAENGWTLLLVLKTINDNQSPSRFRLRVSDQIEILDEQDLITNNNNNYIYTQIEGNYDDKFITTVISETGETQVFPAFEFIRE
ncbi:MAG: DUF1822 family protein [Cyanobacteria bacterium J06633_8]